LAARRRGRARLVLFSGVAIACPAALSSCDRSPSTLDPSGVKSQVVTDAWWILFAVAAFVCLMIAVLVVGAAVVRRRARDVSNSDRRKYVLGFGVVFPGLVLAATFGLSLVTIVKNSDAATPTGTTVEVIGHQWWWEVRYQGTSIVTANEIHIPVGQPVRLRLEAADVIHSFWVPQLMPKMDMIPGRVNETWVKADKVGTYRGQCAEYCGLQHAHMAFEVVVDSDAAFKSFLSREQRAVATPTSSLLRRGMQVVTNGPCATCHTIRGTSADGHVGPDLTDVGSRWSLGAGAIPNNPGTMSGWIADSQSIKPGNKMPPQHLSPHDLHAVVAYLQSLE
jgi:cytochrome c oxidase subunit 2